MVQTRSVVLHERGRKRAGWKHAAGRLLYNNRHHVMHGVKSAWQWANKTYRGRHRTGHHTKEPPLPKLVADDVHSGVSTIHINVPGNKIKPKGAGGAVFHLWQSTYSKCTNFAGLQAVTNCVAFNTVNQWLRTSLTTSNVYGNGFRQYFEYNPNELNTGSDLVTAAVKPLNDRLAFRAIHVDAIYRNLSSTDSFATVYVLRCVRDTITPPAACWQAGIDARSAGNATVLMPAPGVTDVVPAGGSSSILLVGTRPSDVHYFKQYYKILHVRSMNMGPGATERIMWHVPVNYVGKKELLSKLDNQLAGSANLSVYPKGSIHFMMIAHGSIGIDTTAAGNSDPVVSATMIAANYFAKLSFQTMYGGAARQEFGFAYTNLPANEALANVKQVDIVDADNPTVIAG